MMNADLSTPSNVITLCDYEMCPTIKSVNETNTIIVVKSDGNSLSIETGTNHDCDNHCKSPENCSVGGAHQ
jgi:hypothetical protein